MFRFMCKSSEPLAEHLFESEFPCIQSPLAIASSILPRQTAFGYYKPSRLIFDIHSGIGQSLPCCRSSGSAGYMQFEGLMTCREAPWNVQIGHRCTDEQKRSPPPGKRDGIPWAVNCRIATAQTATLVWDAKLPANNASLRLLCRCILGLIFLRLMQDARHVLSRLSALLLGCNCCDEPFHRYAIYLCDSTVTIKHQRLRKLLDDKMEICNYQR